MRALLALARELGLQTVVEGVEDTAQLDLLREWGCDLYQGFLGAGALDEQVTDGTGEPVALCGTVLASPVAGDGDGEGRPEAQGVPDAEIEVGLDCVYDLLATGLDLY